MSVFSLAWVRDVCLRPEVRYSVVVVVLIVAIGVVFEVWKRKMASTFAVMNRTTATLVEALASPFTAAVASTGRYVSFHGFRLEIIPECTGLFEVMIFASCVVAYPASWKARAWGLALGSLIIYALNVLRITTLLIAGYYSRELFELLHVYLWQVMLIGMVASVWLGWLLLFVRR